MGRFVLPFLGGSVFARSSARLECAVFLMEIAVKCNFQLVWQDVSLIELVDWETALGVVVQFSEAELFWVLEMTMFSVAPARQSVVGCGICELELVKFEFEFEFEPMGVEFAKFEFESAAFGFAELLKFELVKIELGFVKFEVELVKFEVELGKFRSLHCPWNRSSIRTKTPLLAPIYLPIRSLVTRQEPVRREGPTWTVVGRVSPKMSPPNDLQ